LGHGFIARLVAGAAVLALPTVILAFMYGQSRIFFVMARDGLLPTALAALNPRTGSPVLVTLFTAVVAAAIAGFFPLDIIAALANAGTLCAFIAVCVAMMVARRRHPDRARPFRTPLWPLVGIFGVVGCLYLFTNLPTKTIWLFFVWNAVGLIIYFAFGRTRLDAQIKASAQRQSTVP
jgi:APA family basic amino acid/polyamine antiporter